jgi:hypothetical protein
MDSEEFRLINQDTKAVDDIQVTGPGVGSASAGSDAARTAVASLEATVYIIPTTLEI